MHTKLGMAGRIILSYFLISLSEAMESSSGSSSVDKSTETRILVTHGPYKMKYATIEVGIPACMLDTFLYKSKQKRLQKTLFEPFSNTEHIDFKLRWTGSDLSEEKTETPEDSSSESVSDVSKDESDRNSSAADSRNINICPQCSQRLPEGWKADKTGNGEVIFYYEATCHILKEHPCRSKSLERLSKAQPAKRKNDESTKVLIPVLEPEESSTETIASNGTLYTPNTVDNDAPRQDTLEAKPDSKHMKMKNDALKRHQDESDMIKGKCKKILSNTWFRKLLDHAACEMVAGLEEREIHLSIYTAANGFRPTYKYEIDDFEKNSKWKTFWKVVRILSLYQETNIDEWQSYQACKSMDPESDELQTALEKLNNERTKIHLIVEKIHIAMQMTEWRFSYEYDGYIPIYQNTKYEIWRKEKAKIWRMLKKQFAEDRLLKDINELLESSISLVASN